MRDKRCLEKAAVKIPRILLKIMQNDMEQFPSTLSLLFSKQILWSCSIIT